MITWQIYELQTDLAVMDRLAQKEQYRMQLVTALLRRHKVKVQRFSMLQNPQIFLTEAVVSEVLDTYGDLGFPLVICEGQIVAKGYFPTDIEFSDLSKLDIELFKTDISDNELDLWLNMMRGLMGEGLSCASMSSCEGCKGCGPIIEEDREQSFDPF